MTSIRIHYRYIAIDWLLLSVIILLGSLSFLSSRWSTTAILELDKFSWPPPESASYPKGLMRTLVVVNSTLLLMSLDFWVLCFFESQIFFCCLRLILFSEALWTILASCFEAKKLSEVKRLWLAGRSNDLPPSGGPWYFLFLALGFFLVVVVI